MGSMYSCDLGAVLASFAIVRHSGCREVCVMQGMGSYGVCAFMPRM
jgi:hypothetical protein